MPKTKRELYYSTISLIISFLTLISVFVIRYLDKKETLSIQLVENDSNFSTIAHSSGVQGNWDKNNSYRTKTRTIILSNSSDSKINVAKLGATIEYKNEEIKSKFCEVNFYNDKNERIYLPYEMESNSSKIIFIVFKFNTIDSINSNNDDLEAVGANLKITTTKNNVFESFIAFQDQ